MDLLLSAKQLAARLDGGDVLVFDCRFDLADPGRGRRAWLDGHVPGARYAHLDDDLSGPLTGASGRHPLPAPEAFAAFLARSGWTPGCPVVAYDAQGGAFAARLWWLLRYFGQPQAALLDGGIDAWTRAGLPLETGPVVPEPAPAVKLQPDPSLTLDAESVRRGLSRGEIVLLDARAANRFAGRDETLDPVAGHVPGARNRPFALNLDAGGRFRDTGELREGFATTAGDAPARVVHMCGSGVTACHNLYAMELAGLPGSRLYPGSWSEWIRDPARPVATGGDD